MIAQYWYDAANRRVKQVVNGVTTHTLWEGMHAIAEFTVTGSTPVLAAHYVFMGSRMIAVEQAGSTTRYTHPDRLSTRMLTSTSGAVVGTQSHRPFGDEDVVTGTTDKHRFTNYERDGVGSDYAMNRQYGSGTGRFAQVDPFGGSAGSPGSLNRYAYVQGDPINFKDPSGLLRYTAPPPALPVGYGPSMRNLLGPGDRPAIIDKTWKFALGLLEHKPCADFVAGTSEIDARTALESIKLIDTKMNSSEWADAPAAATTGAGTSKPIELYNPFFSENSQEVAPDAEYGTFHLGQKYAVSEGHDDLTPVRAFVLLHELRHALAGIHHSEKKLAKGMGKYESWEKFNQGLYEACFGIQPNPYDGMSPADEPGSPNR